MLQIQNLTKSFNSNVLFQDCSFFINEGERVALIGANGTGKTTLFRIILGEESWDSGEIILQKNASVGFLPQEIDSISGYRILDEVISCSPEIKRLHNEMDVLRTLLARSKKGCEKDVLRKYGNLQARFEQIGGYDLEHRAEKILLGLGFCQEDFSRPAGEFSGGWQMRIAMAKMLLNSFDLMMLDEPTNHLDLTSSLWLQDYLLSCKGTFIFTSHDREFINLVATRIVGISEGKFRSHRGNYDSYVKQEDMRKESLRTARQKQERKKKQTEIFINKFRAKATRAKSVQSKIKMLEKMEIIEISQERKSVRIRFPQPERSSYEAIKLQKVCKSYGENQVYGGIDLTVYRGDRIALVGKNGAGKSTLLKILAGVLDIDAGSRVPGKNVSIGYYPQHRLDILNPNSTCFEEISQVCRDGRETAVRNFLGRFLFSGDDVFKNVSLLSGGEKSRLVLAKILSNPPNVMLMDEPINHLDMPSREVLIEAMKEFTGTICFISHDEYFIEQIASRIIEIYDRNLKIFPGGYDYYRHKKCLDEKNGKTESSTHSPLKKETGKKKPVDRIPKKNVSREKYEKRILSGKLAKLEEEITRETVKLEQIDRVFSDPETYKQHSTHDLRDLAEERKQIKVLISRLTIEWEECVETLDKFLKLIR